MDNETLLLLNSNICADLDSRSLFMSYNGILAIVLKVKKNGAILGGGNNTEDTTGQWLVQKVCLIASNFPMSCGFEVSVPTPDLLLDRVRGSRILLGKC